jgi:hypothetical protein
MADVAFVEILQDGVTIGGRVRMEGEVVRVPGFKVPEKSEQTKKWGQPRLKSISEKEFNERGGGDTAVPTELTPPEPPAQEPAQPEAGEFDSFADLNVEATLDEVAKLDDAATARFIEWEKAGQARKGVLGPLGVEE